MIFGQFIEHLGRCIYGHLQGRLAAFRYGGSPTAAIRPFCVGPAVISSCSITGKRPSVPKTSGRGSWIRHGSPSSRTASGTNECIEYCRAIGAEPYFCINLGTGTIGEVADWVEYCNGTKDQPAAEAWIPEPHSAKFWGLGNEMPKSSSFWMQVFELPRVKKKCGWGLLTTPREA